MKARIELMNLHLNKYQAGEKPYKINTDKFINCMIED